MRIRAIKPEFWADEEIASWPAATRLLYIALWNESDDEGRLRANPEYLRANLFPYEPELDVRALLAPIIDSGKLLLYTVRGQTFGQLTRFNIHQRIDRAKKSSLPAPEEGTRVQLETPSKDTDQGSIDDDSTTNHGLINDESTTNRGSIDDDSTTDRRSIDDESTGKGREGKGMEGNSPLPPRGGRAEESSCDPEPVPAERLPEESVLDLLLGSARYRALAERDGFRSAYVDFIRSRTPRVRRSFAAPKIRLDLDECLDWGPERAVAAIINATHHADWARLMEPLPARGARAGASGDGYVVVDGVRRGRGGLSEAEWDASHPGAGPLPPMDETDAARLRSDPTWVERRAKRRSVGGKAA